jgi:hypothetical protein
MFRYLIFLTVDILEGKKRPPGKYLIPAWQYIIKLMSKPEKI